MRLGLISDTHVPSTGSTPPAQTTLAFAGVDLILHAGDVFTADCLDWLETIAPVVAVEMFPSPLMDDPRVAARRVVEVGNYAIGMMHDLIIPGTGFEPVPGAIGAKFPAEVSLPEAMAKVFGRPVDIVVFGHTHRALVEEHQGILFINPGSSSLPNQRKELGTVGILELTPDGRQAAIVNLIDVTG